MSLRISLLASVLLVVVAFVYPVLVWDSLPDSFATHWNIEGEADQYMSKSIGAFIMPTVIALIILPLLFLPRIDPLRHKIETFRQHYNTLIVLLTGFLTYIHVLMVLYNTGRVVNLAPHIAVALGILFVYLGFLMKVSKRNWIMGIRTPWTLSSDRVWAETHKRGSVLFTISGVIAMLGVVVPDWWLSLVILPVLASAIYLIIYSYIAYQQESDHTID